MSKKNVLFLSIDTLSYCRLGIGGNVPSPSPFMDNLINSSFSFSNCFANGCPTQMSFPSIMSSKYPLDNGGYGRGILHREITLAEVFKENGYKTAAFITGNGLQKYFGYDRGFDDYFSFVDFNVTLNSFKKAFMDFYEGLYTDGVLTIQDCIKIIGDDFLCYFDFLLDYCSEKTKEVDFVVPSQKLHGYDFKNIYSYILEEKKAYESNSVKYLQELFNQNNCRLFSLLNINNKHLSYKYRAQMALFYLSLLQDTQLEKGLYSHKQYIKKIYKYINNNVSERFVSTDYTFSNFAQWFNKKQIENAKPFFIWLHLSDLHDNAFTPHDYESPALKNHLQVAKRHLDIINEHKEYFGNKDYDLSIKYIDNKVKNIVSFFQSNGLWDDMILVLISDHGSKKIFWPIRDYENGKIKTVDFYDELYHVPVAFHHKDINKNDINSLTSLIDVAPTLLNYAGLKIPNSFIGNNINDNGSGREYLIMENLGPGPCDFDFKPINIAIRSKNKKLLLQQNITDSKGIIKAAFDLYEDPHEKNNLVCMNDLNSSFNPLLNEAHERIEDIRGNSL